MNSSQTTYTDFILLEKTYIAELQSTFYLLEHRLFGTRVLHLENQDIENFFCISFQTIPTSSNGIAHILEHCVLCGSKKYPVRDPFFSMRRRSLHTYMNALTGSDFTCYPVATQYKKDFYNLLDVYLDSVFDPNLNEMNFAQEGYRFDFEEKTLEKSSSLSLKGIVYNEMKGALSNPIARLFNAISVLLFPDNTYGKESGGDPIDIPSLTLDELKKFHEKYYSLENCLLFFYGNIPLEEHLEYLQKNIFQNRSHISRKKNEPIPLQPRFLTPKSSSIPYPVDVIDEKNPSSYYTLSWLTTHITDQVECLALLVLNTALMSTDASPLKKELLATGLCRNISSSLDLEIQEIPYTIMITGIDQKNIQEMEHAIFSSLRKIVTEGIPSHILESAFHQIALKKSEIVGDGTPFGLILYFRSALLAHHHSNPISGLCIHDRIAELQALLQKNPLYFSDLIEKYLLNNTHRVSLLMYPSIDLGEEESNAEANRLQEFEKTLSEDDKKNILIQNQQLEEYQQQEEDLTILPSIAIEEIPIGIQKFELEKHSFTNTARNITLFSHTTFTNRISYLDIAFSFPHIDYKDMWLTRLFVSLLPHIGTQEIPYDQFLEKVQASTGGLSASVEIVHNAQDADDFYLSWTLSGKALEENLEKLVLLCSRLLEAPGIKDKRRIEDLIKKQYTSLRNSASSHALQYAIFTANKQINLSSAIEEEWFGISYYKKLEELVNNYSDREAEFLNQLSTIAHRLIRTSQETDVILSAQEKSVHAITSNRLWLLSELSSDIHKEWSQESFYQIEKYDDTLSVLFVPQTTAYTVMSFQSLSYADIDTPYISLAAQIMENRVLHKRIREQGGAYGAGVSFQPSKGVLYFYSYRDPNITSTIEAFMEGIETICSGDFDQDDLEEAQREIIQILDTPIAPGSRANFAYELMKSHKDEAMRLEYRTSILSANRQSIQQAAIRHFIEKKPKRHLATCTGKELFEKEKQKLSEKNIQYQEHPFL